MMRNWLNLVIALVALIISLVLIFQVSGWKTVVVDLEKRVEEVAEEVGELEKVGGFYISSSGEKFNLFLLICWIGEKD